MFLPPGPALAMAAYEQQLQLPTSHLPSSLVVQVGGSRFQHIKQRPKQSDAARGVRTAF